jgi:hypothetical protein
MMTGYKAINCQYLRLGESTHIAVQDTYNDYAATKSESIS